MSNLMRIVGIVTLCGGIFVAGLGLGIAQDEIRFKKIRGDEAGGAVLGFGKQGEFDANWVTCPTVVWDGSQYKMWYSSFYDSKMGRGGIGFCTSRDGIKWQRQNDGEPVLTITTGSEFDNGQVMGPCVLPNINGYTMWYTGMAKDWHESGFGFYRIGLATSSNGISWKRGNDGRPVVDTGNTVSYDNVQSATPSVIKEGDIYRMWYAAWSSDPDKNHRICMATSSNGIKWSKENGGRPITGLMPELAYAPEVVRFGDEYILFYTAIKAAPGLFAAKSRDGTHWTMLNGGKPVLLPGKEEDFDSLRVGHPCALARDGKIMLWYTGYKIINGELRLSVGLAVQEL